MTQQDCSDDNLIEMWLTAHDEAISEAERAELNRLIVANSHLRERLIHLSQEQSWLMWHGAEGEPCELVVQPSTVAQRVWSKTPALSGRSAPRQFTRRWRAVGLVTLSILGLFAIWRWSTQESSLAKVAPPKWPLKASVLQIESGSATLDLPDVGHVVLEGPTELELLDPMRARLKQGRIRVRVTQPTSHGFVVEYPEGQVTDLGTEFGLHVPAAGTRETQTSLVVFDGSVDLQRSAAATQPVENAPTERLIRGEGVTFRAGGELDRIMSIVTGKFATFQRGSDSQSDKPDLVILDVNDNLRSSDTKKFYEIVPRGFGEDALAYVDRPAHQWNGVNEAGLPPELIGADYVKTFGDDDMRTDVEINVMLGRPAKLYVFFDNSLEPPDWLRKEFHKTKDKVGMDVGPWPTINRVVETGVGPGKSIDHEFTVWVNTVRKPGVVTLGANRVRKDPYMYGIAAVALDGPHPAPSSDNKSAAK